ncbi:MAG: helix-turn-helix domain-containing protein [Planctomycetota bacterium]
MDELHDDVDVQELTPGGRLEYMLDELRLTQTALADMCGVTPQYVNNIVRRGQRVTEEFAVELAEALDCNLNWLYTGEGEMLQSDQRAKEQTVDYETLNLEDQLRNASDHLKQAADDLSEARRQQKEDHG